MTLKEIKSSFFQSECGKYIREGVEVSEPIPTLDKGKLIDVFFIYKTNREKDLYTMPLVKFGIISEEKKMVFSESLYDGSGVKAHNDIISGSGNRKERIQHYPDYEATYNKARALFYCECTGDEKILIQDYWRAFQKYVEPHIVAYYIETVPEFFSWLQKQCR